MMKRSHHFWTEQEKEIVRTSYRYTRKSAEELAERLSHLTQERITVPAVLWQAGELGMRRSRGQEWAPAEEALLYEIVHKYCLAKVARILNRSPSSVRDKCYGIGIRLRFRDGWFNATDVASIFGVSKTLVFDRIKRGLLLAEPHSEGVGHGYMWHITEANLAEYIRKYPQDLVGRNIDVYTIVDLLASNTAIDLQT